MKKSHILMIGTDLESKGGISSVIRLYEQAGLFREISKKPAGSVSVEFLASYRDGSTIEKFSHYSRFLAQFIQIMLMRPEVRVVHIHGASKGSFARKSLVVLLAKAFGRKVLFHMHGAGFCQLYTRMPKGLQWGTRHVLNSCDQIIALSNGWRDDLYNISGHRNIRVLYNPTEMMPRSGASLSSLPPTLTLPHKGGGDVNLSKEENQFELITEQSLVHFLFMGRLGQRKGVYDIIEAARHLKNSFVRIHLYGDGDREEILNRIEAAQVGEKVILHGWIGPEEKEQVFEQSDVLLLPSYHEGLPMSVLEAMAHGLPILASTVGGIPEAVEDGVQGFLIQPGDIQSLAQRIDELALSLSLRQYMGKCAYEKASTHFALPLIMRQLEDLYAELAQPA